MNRRWAALSVSTVLSLAVLALHVAMEFKLWGCWMQLHGGDGPVYPAIDPDGAKWVACVQSGQWLHSPIDALDRGELPRDGSLGRGGVTFVYWPRAVFMGLHALSVGVRALTGLDWEASVVYAAAAFGPMMGVCYALLTAWLGVRVFGARWGLGFSPCLMLMDAVRSKFSMFMVDHHGLILVVTTLWVLLFFAPQSGGKDVWSWVGGAVMGVGLWLSTLTTLGLVGLWGVCGVLGAVIGQCVATPERWRRWGMSAAVVSVVLWLCDYALRPGQVWLRLEVNHPLWALGVGAGAILVAECVALRFSPKSRWLSPGRAIACAAIVGCPVVCVVYTAGAMFWPMYPWVGQLMLFISELLPLEMGIWVLATAGVPFFVCFGLMRARGGRTWGLALMGLGSSCLALFQTRWIGFCVVLGLCALWALGSWNECGRVVRVLAPGMVGVVVLCAAMLFAVTFSRTMALTRATVSSPGSRFERTIGALELARALDADARARGKEGYVVLGPPDVGTWVSYYSSMPAGARTVGSMYWEAWRGLKAAWDFELSNELSQALVIVERYGVDYVVVNPGQWKSVVRIDAQGGDDNQTMLRWLSAQNEKEGSRTVAWLERVDFGALEPPLGVIVYRVRR